jgi:hypothetical protein
LSFVPPSTQSSRTLPTILTSYVAAEILETQVEELYQRVQLPESWLERVEKELDAEITARQVRNAAEREFLARRLAKAEGERRKLLDAYYAGAIDVAVLKAEQKRISNDVRSVEERLAAVDAHLSEWREMLGLAMRFATNCGTAYERANDKTRRLLNQAVVGRIEVRDGRIASVEYRVPFDVLFRATELEYGDLVEVTGFEPLTS